MIKSLVIGILMLFSSAVFAVSFHVDKDGTVGGYYTGASAGNTSYLSIIVNDVTRFEGFNNHSTPINTYVNFGEYQAGDNVEFVMYGISIPGNTWYSDITRNSDQVDHMQYHDLTLNGSNSLYVSWEDLPFSQSDLDFNDGNFVITNVVASIPEPETYAMLLVGLGLIALSVRRRRRDDGSGSDDNNGGGGGGFIGDGGSASDCWEG